ncbi:MAG: MFS transporter [Verrucomicrobia bacterium]|nr:MFS transporter [Verrucomicrobiota bacterium]
MKTAWRVVALLFPVALLNYLDRQMLAAMKDSVMLGLPDIVTEARWGMLGAVFKWVYAGLSPVGGFIADRTSKRWMVITSLGVWSTVTWATGQVHNYEQMLWTRALMGVSEACYIPAALALIAEFHTGPTRSRAIGVHQMGIYAGIALGGFSGLVADSSHGWRAAFNWCGAFGVFYAIVLVFLLRDQPKANPAADARSAISVAPVLRELFSKGAFILLVLYFTLPALAGWVVKDWMPPILRKMFQMGQGTAGLWATLPVTIASFAGALLGGMIADAWMKATPRGRIFTSAVGMALCIPALIGVGYAPSLFVAIVCLVVFGIGWGFFDCNNMPILCQIVRPELRATGYGIMNFVSISVGAFATWQVGALRDAGHPPSLIFSICAAAAALSVVLVLLIRPRMESQTSEVRQGGTGAAQDS